MDSDCPNLLLTSRANLDKLISLCFTFIICKIGILIVFASELLEELNEIISELNAAESCQAYSKCSKSVSHRHCCHGHHHYSYPNGDRLQVKNWSRIIRIQE